MPKHLQTTLEIAALAAVTAGITVLVAQEGTLPSPYTNLYLLPISWAAWRGPLLWPAVIALVAGLASSPAMGALGVEMHQSLRPLLWLGWPAVFLFLAVTLNQWRDLRCKQKELESAGQTLQVFEVRNVQREEELQTLSYLHDALLRGEDEENICNEFTRRAAILTGAKLSVIAVPKGQEQAVYANYGFSQELIAQVHPTGIPFGEGVAGWAMLHRSPAWSANVFRDARYDKLQLFARQVGYTSAAAAPIEFDGELFGALVICYEEEREFSADELARLERLARQAALAIYSIRQRGNLSSFASETAIALTEAIESRDPYTGGHCHRLAQWAMDLAKSLDLPPRDIEAIGLGAALHDVGKIVVPDVILMKPGRLTPVEFAAIKQHCYSGGQICKRVPFLQAAYPIVYHHHERYDGSGYPDGLQGEEIPLGARIVAVVDALDAMTTDRPYRQALAQGEAEAILRKGAGQQWDPRLVGALLEMIRNGHQPSSSERTPSFSAPPGGHPSKRDGRTLARSD